jgi:hypothetical protein
LKTREPRRNGGSPVGLELTASLSLPEDATYIKNPLYGRCCAGHIRAIRMLAKPNELHQGFQYTMEGRQPAMFAAEIRNGH